MEELGGYLFCFALIGILVYITKDYKSTANGNMLITAMYIQIYKCTFDMMMVWDEKSGDH